MKDFHIQWHITEKCNLNCLHCYKEPNRIELPLFKLKALMKNIAKFLGDKNTNLFLTITGGEPFLVLHIYELLYFLNQNEIVKRINIITNGTVLPKENLKEISKLGIIYISIESLNPEINDKIRGKGTLKKVLSNIEYFVKEYNNVGIMTTLMKTNFFDLKENFETFVSDIFKLKIKEIIFERFIPAGNSKNLKSEMLTSKEIFDFYYKISSCFNLELRQLQKYPAIKLVNNSVEYFDIKKISVYGAKCIFGKDGLAILCDGTIYPCRRFDKAVGNFLDFKGTISSFSKKIKIISKNFKNSKTNNCFLCYASLNSLQ